MIQGVGRMGRPGRREMELFKNLAKAQKLALRKAIEKDAPQPLVAAFGGWLVPSADELAYELAGAEVVAVYGPAGEDAAGIWV